jgi:ribA/ribD-fused uncharacterized protein
VKERPGVTVKGGFTLFFREVAVFSNWHKASFTVSGVRFNCMEQYMMHAKAKLFGDHKMADRILATPNPKDQKALGRQVAGYQESVWVEHRFPIVLVGAREKFHQNPHLLEALLETEGTELVEASPYDSIWGAGLGAQDPRILDKKNWPGLNLLGQVLDQVRGEALTSRAPARAVLQVGSQFTLAVDQTDSCEQRDLDDFSLSFKTNADGERITPAGAVWEIRDLEPYDDLVMQYSVVCPTSGAWIHIGHTELDFLGFKPYVEEPRQGPRIIYAPETPVEHALSKPYEKGKEWLCQMIDAGLAPQTDLDAFEDAFEARVRADSPE